MDRLQYHKERLDKALGFKRDENFVYEIEDVPQTSFVEPQEDNSIKESNAYKKYFGTREEVLEEAKVISENTGIPYDSIIVDADSMAKAREIYNYKKKVMDFDAVYKKYPALKKLNENDGAISLHNIKDVEKVTGFFEAAKVGWDTDNISSERNRLGYDAFIGDDIDEDRLKQVEEQLGSLKEIPSLLEAPLVSMAGGGTTQLRMMARHLIQSLDTAALGATVGAVGNAVLSRENIALAPAMIAGARAALPASFKAGMAIEMFKESVGGSYLTYRGYKDKFGNQLLTDGEARTYAAVSAAIETGIEFANYDAIINVLKGSKATLGAGKLIQEIVKNAKDNASVRAQLKNWLDSNARNIGVVAGTEVLEEGAQAASEMVVTNVAQKLNPEGNIPQYSVGDIALGAGEAMYQAAPASILFGVAGQGASNIRFTRQTAQLLSMSKERADEALRTHTGVELVNKLVGAARTTKLGKEHKETFNKLMKSSLEGTAHEKAYVDTELLIEQEGGEVVLNQLAAVAGYTEEQLKTFKETGTPIEVNTADLVSAISEQNEINLNDYISFDAADRCFARNQKVAVETKKLIDKMNTEEVTRLVDNVNILATEMFGETEERDYATRIITEYEDPSAGIEERRKEISQEIDGMIDPVVETMRSGMGKGVALYDVDDYGNVIDATTDHDSHIGGKVRYSNNDAWYTRYFKENKKAPSDSELRELAEEAITGNNPYGIGDYDYTDPDMVALAEETKMQLEKLRNELELLDKVEAKLKNVDKGEFAALDALTQEGVKVFKEVADKFRSMPNKAVQRQASLGALVYAHRADRHAAAMRLLGNKKYTALDYMKAHPVGFGGEVERGALGQSAENEIPVETFYTTSIKGDELGDYVDLKDLRKKAVDWYKENLTETTAYNPVLGAIRIERGLTENEINFNAKAKDKMKQTSAKKEKLLAVTHLKEIITNSNFITESEPYKPSHEMDHFYYLHAKIKGGAFDYIIVTVIEGRDKILKLKNFNVYTESEYKKEMEDALTRDNPSLTKSGQSQRGASSKVSIADENKIFNQQRVFYQSAWVGSGAVFDKFDVGYIGTGEGGMMHGWGLYSAKNKKVAQKYKKLVGGKKGALYEVDVPEYDVLLDEQKMFKDQDGNVKKLLVGAVNNLDHDQKTRFWERVLSRVIEEDGRISMAEFDLIGVELKQDAFNQIVGKFAFTRDAARKRLLEQGYTEEQINEFAENQELANKEKTKFDAEIQGIKDKIEALKKEDERRRADVMQNAFDNPAESLERIAGEQMYLAFTYAVSGKTYDYRMGSEYLNSQGIKGITYDGAQDGRCFVVFDDKAISIINRFNQGLRPKGQTIVKSTGERIIKLFETADESTFIHEIGHVAYEDLRELASMENAPAQFKRDLKTLDDWANWKEGQLDEYVGSAVYKEFSARDAAIREAIANGDEALLEQLKYEWRQERFARGWEEYLKKGKAPTEGLRRVFYEFKKWLTKIYRAYRSIGGAPTKEVEAVMTRLLLTDEAIELAEKKAELEAFEKSGVFNYLGDNAQAMWQKILEDVRKDATSKVLKIAMKDMSDAAKLEREDKIKAERKAAFERMPKEPVWGIYSTLEYNPKASVSGACKAFNMTVDEYVAQLKANGGSLERAVDRYMKKYIAELETPDKREIERRAEEAVTGSYYKQLLSALEVELLQREVRREVRLSKKIADINAETEEERQEAENALRELDKKAEELRSRRALRDVAVGNAETIREIAKSKLAIMSASYSANPTVWKNASRQQSAKMTAALANKEYGKAVQAAKWRLVYDTMTDLANENKNLVDGKSKKMRDRAKTIRREKNMAADDRYVYMHMLYAFGLAERDVPVPPNYDGFESVLVSIKKNTDFGLENMSINFVDKDGNLKLSDFIINAGTGDGRYGRGVADLTISEFKELADFMDNIYTVSVNANKTKTIKGENGEAIDVTTAVKEIADEADERRKLDEPKDTTRAGNITLREKALGTFDDFHIMLIKAETILGELAPAAVKYIYDPIKRASDDELKMSEEFAAKIKGIKDAWYGGKVEIFMNRGMTEAQARKAADEEFKEMYTEEKYKLGTSMITKENIIAFALNWGTEVNRDRAINYPGTTKASFERIFAELDSADWQFITNVWDLFEETWPQVKEVEARMNGVTLEKQEGIDFNITGKDGTNYIIKGKYYPIKYDPAKHIRVSLNQKEEGIRTKLPSKARLGIGTGMTKERAVATSYLIRNDLGVFGEAINENIHLICMREAIRDVSRIVNDAEFMEMAERYIGKNAVKMLNEWVLDCWQVEPKAKNRLEQAMGYLRRKQTMAVLGFRTTTAALNICNLGPMMSYLGAARTKKALWDFYAHPQKQKRFVMERSVFVRKRAETMDRDMRDVLKNKKPGFIESKAFSMLTQTDLALACPLWISEYQRVYQENIEKGLAADVLERKAVDAGDRAVRTVFGSGLTQDLAAVQKGSELTKMLTMFYSYFSVVYQAAARTYYERRRRTINKGDWFERNIPVLDLVLNWYLIPAVFAVAIRPSGDDEMEPKDYLIKIGAETINTAAGGVPILRDMTSMLLTYMTEGRYYGARNTPIGDATENMMDVIRSIKGYAEDKKDADDVARAVLRTGSYLTGLPVVGADGIATIMQWFEYGDATPEEIGEYLAAILAGKKVQK